ncbi:hypothetical protein RJ639_014973 [Escallonia herrerae]|uniref:Uncharacterized protein n=1 Tax=Escallonia herrerae TaxID=1293975 RepID=A0AA88VGU0_9ASTE|nr:hypothetical protein RJ639_014973 [Escallonia herrerae]
MGKDDGGQGRRMVCPRVKGPADPIMEEPRAACSKEGEGGRDGGGRVGKEAPLAEDRPPGKTLGLMFMVGRGRRRWRRDGRKGADRTFAGSRQELKQGAGKGSMSEDLMPELGEARVVGFRRAGEHTYTSRAKRQKRLQEVTVKADIEVEGMQRPCSGAMDKSPPKEIFWKAVPHRLFFGRDRTSTWGPGGVAFLHPASNIQDKAYMCLYRITLEQFNDVLLQENILSDDYSSPVFDLTALDSIANGGSISLDALKRGWYNNVVCLGTENGVPILTMTCTLPHIESFKSGKFPLCAPGKEYASTMVKGLVAGKQLSEDEAVAYIQEASTKPL